MREWEDYRIAFSQSSDGPPRLQTVYHVAHVSDARRILEDDRLRAGLVYDQSKLRDSRILVTWVSANMWVYGSIYGNVQFAFRWADLIGGRRFYWVEAITRYRPPAYRILLTQRDLSHATNLRDYDPSSDRGPVRERAGLWYWNDQYTSEFMIEADLDLTNCTGLEFISHNSNICRVRGGTCQEQRTPPYRTAGRVVAFILGQRTHTMDHVLRKSRSPAQRNRLSWAMEEGIDGIRLALGGPEVKFRGSIKAPTSRKAVVRGALALYGMGKVRAARELIALLKTRSVFEDALTETVNEHFNITGWTIE